MSEINTLVAQEPFSTRGRIDKRTAILEAAYRVFEREGYERASVDSIAAEAGVAKPTIYSHFNGKDDLFRQTLLESVAGAKARTLEQIEKIPHKPKNLHDEFLTVGYQLSGCLTDQRAMTLQRLLWAEIAHFPDLYDTIRSYAGEPIVNALAGRLAMLANAGYLDVPDPVRAANQLISLTCDELKTISAFGTKSVDPEIWNQTIAAGVETFLRAYAKK
jgi:AcrR family transcriptional regulator